MAAERIAAGLAGAAALAAWAGLAALAGTYLVYPGWVDHGEPSIAIQSWRLLDGITPYPGLDSAERTTNFYGPVTYLIHALAYAVGGGHVMVAKVASLVAVLAVPGVVFRTHRSAGTAAALTAAFAATAFALLHVPASLWNRPDSFLALTVAAAVWAARRGERSDAPWLASLMVGACGGLAVGFKIHAGVLVLPVALHHLWGRPIGHWAAVATAGVAVALAPFALEPFSLAGYLGRFGVLGSKETAVSELVKLLQYSVPYLVPGVLLVALGRSAPESVRRRETVYVAGLVVALGLLLVPASRPGAGFHYLYPLAPIAIDMGRRAWERAGNRRRWVAAALALVAVVVSVAAVPETTRFRKRLDWDMARGAAAEIAALMADGADAPMQMGLGQDNATTYRLIWMRVPLVLAGHPNSLDHATQGELTALGIPPPQATYDALARCDTEVWLVPAGEEPFAMTGFYGPPVYDRRFRDLFRETYEKAEGHRYYDLWTCRAGRHPASR